MANGLYTPGRKPQYGKARWARYERLRVRGFAKNEARELSRVDHPDDTKIVQWMIADRRAFLREFERVAAAERWSDGQRQYHFYKGLRNWYSKRGYGSKTKPLMAWFHATENRLARSRGWRKGQYDPSKPESEQEPGLVRRRTKWDTPYRKGAGGKGRISAQRARAAMRKFAYKHGYTDNPSAKVGVSMVRGWIRELREAKLKQPEKAAQFDKQIAHHEKSIHGARGHR